MFDYKGFLYLLSNSFCITYKGSRTQGPKTIAFLACVVYVLSDLNLEYCGL